MEDGEQVLNTKQQLHEPGLVLEPVKRVIREEYLREPVPKLLHRGALWW